MSRDSHRFSVGSFECIALRDASETVPIANLNAGRYEPALVWVLTERGQSPTEVTLGFNCLLIGAGKDCILVDAGWGSCTERLQGRLLANLRKEGIAPRDVTLVILTHHDRDHLAGIVASRGQLAYPNARYVMTDEGWAWYTSEANLSRLGEPYATFHRTVLPLVEGRVARLEGETEVLPGIRVIPAPGHRPGHVAVALSSSGERLLHLADVVLHPLFVEHPEWGSGIDDAPDQALATRRQLLERTAQEKALVFAPHLPFPGLGYVRREGEAWRWLPVGGAS